MEKILYPTKPVQCIISGKSSSGKSTLILKILFQIITELDKIYIYSPTIHQDSYQNNIKCCNSFLPLNVINNILQEDIAFEDWDDIIEVIINKPDFERSPIECESYENIDESKDAQEYDGEKQNIIILDRKIKRTVKRLKCSDALQRRLSQKFISFCNNSWVLWINQRYNQKKYINYSSLYNKKILLM